ncbi:methyltransferase, FkbM family [Shimia gijangensis]|uniref:Methyltransferase, FkbM family n=1 Tax=Shimia gijangensis TaxID=1470563 RepID=A0A1M6FL38_9RHOB|nr:FkbM family methyltransferase [Shimia gijangensis]SHI98430.1 methyltransferase, FkbM family [Shimia gijangensis]
MRTDLMQDTLKDLKQNRLEAVPHKTTSPYLRGYEFSPDVVFDVGVENGTGYLYHAYPDAHHVLIDPLSESRDAIAKSGLAVSHDFHCCAVGETPGEAVLNIPTVKRGTRLAMSSLTTRTDKMSQRFLSVEERQVPVRRLDDIAADYTGRFGLKIDTEGHEMQVLRGATAMLDACEFVILELSLTQRFEGINPPSEIFAFLAQHGLEYRDVLAVSNTTWKNPRPRHQDALFTRWESA